MSQSYKYYSILILLINPDLVVSLCDVLYTIYLIQYSHVLYTIMV